jgi:4-amino-4-deoxy-L-arabinose transferase-like glycosyltransferase
MTNHEDRYLKLSLAVSTAILFLSLGGRALWDTDEARYAEIAREILVLNDWLTPHLNFLLYFEKPMLYMWLVAIAFKIFGISESAAHIVSLLAALGGAGLVGLLAWKLWGRRSGVIASLSLITSIEYFYLACAVDINMPLTLFITSALVFFFLGNVEKKSMYYYISWASMALATLTKGPIGVILPLGVICSYIIFSRQFSLIKGSRPITGILLLLAIASPWFILVSLRNPDFFSFFFINQNLERYTGSSEHNKPFYYFILVIIGGALPWTFMLPSAVKKIWQNRMPKEVLYIVIWTFFILFFFMPSHSKLGSYVLPCFPALALIMGYIFKDATSKFSFPLYAAGFFWVCIGLSLIIFPMLQSNGVVRFSSNNVIPLIDIGVMAGVVLILGTVLGMWFGRKHDTALGFSIIGIVILVIVILSAPRWDNLRSTKSLVQDLPPSAKLFAYGRYYQSSTFYSKRQVGLVESNSELRFGIRHNDKKGIVLTIDELANLMNGDTNTYCLTQKERLPILRQKVPELVIVKQSIGRCLVHVPGT